LTPEEFKIKWGIWDDNPEVCLRNWLKTQAGDQVKDNNG
jgi:hypothetical protein